MSARERGQEKFAPLCDREVEGCLETIGQCRLLLEALGPAGFLAAPAGAESSVGAQFRHTVEHFLCFFRGLPTGEIDYDARDRDRGLEGSATRTSEVLEAIRAELESLGRMGDRTLTLCVLPSRHGDAVRLETTLRRELLFLASHTIHHLALIRVLAQMAGCYLPEDIGVAFSTARHREAERQDGRPIPPPSTRTMA